MIYFTSDTHYGHANIIRYCERPFADTEDMTTGMIARWNAIVQPDDEVWHMGDVSMGYKADRITEILEALNGHKILIRGNHDRHWSVTKWKRLGFDDAMPYWEGVVKVGHEPHTVQMVHDPEDSKIRQYPRHNIVLCGHVHGSWKIRMQGTVPYVNVGVDVWDYKPITLQEILQEIKTHADR